jgi:4-amino-4-deoxy-L-arabinose transferase-like glycosyltransferase
VTKAVRLETERLPTDAATDERGSSPAITSLLSGLSRHGGAGVWFLVAAAVILRILLALFCPKSFGYVWDYYHEGVVLFYETGKLPPSEACWQCYHPPLFYIVGLPLYALGRWVFPSSASLPLRVLSVVSLASATVAAYYSYRLLASYENDRGLRLIGMGLILAFPCFFISSYGVEADILLTAIMIAFLYHLSRYWSVAGQPTLRQAAVLGVLAGLAAATKYSGLIAPLAAVVTLLLVARATTNRARVMRQLIVACALCTAIAGWKYVDNLRRFGTPLFANGSAADGFALDSRTAALDRYEFLTFRLRDLLALTRSDAARGQLTTLPVYRSVPTTIYGLAWGDMGFFSHASRHGDPRRPYPDKKIPPWLPSSVMLLGILPTVLAVVGFMLTVRQTQYMPLWITTLLTVASYVLWFTAQEQWALKTKYILFLLPVYIISSLEGMKWVARRAPQFVIDAVLSLILLLIGLAHLYQMAFALGYL